MKILEVKTLGIKDVKTIRFGRFLDERGYFSETYNSKDLLEGSGALPQDVFFNQTNESYSKAGVLRGLHFQFNPHMGKLVRCISGHLVDIALDIRLNSPTFGKAIMCDLPAKKGEQEGVWVWLPPGFAHGTLLLEESLVEYMCSGQYNPKTEASISPSTKPKSL